MSESRNPERLPDQAALDELQRAFADEAVTDPTAPDPPAPDRVADVAELADLDDHPWDGAGDASAHVAAGVADDVAAGVADDVAAGVTGDVADDVVDDVVDDLADEADDAADLGDTATPDWLSDDPGSPPHDELVIVEQVPPAEDPPPARPTIRIDDIGPATGDDVGPGVDDAAVTTGDVEAAGSASGRPTIISIDDADLPDAVYVQGSLDADGSHSIVIIEDDELSEPGRGIDDPDTRRGIEPRLRDRRVAVRRARGRKRLRWLLVGAGVVVVVVGTLAVLGSSLFAVRADQVSLTGAVYADEAALDEVVDDLVGTPTLRADTQRLEAELERIPWVSEAKVRVQFPRAATIEIRERTAWATYQGPDGRYRVLDEEGRVLDVLDGYPFAYVLLAGPDPVDLDPGEFAPRGYAVAAELAKNLTGTVRGRVQMIEVAADGSRLELVLDDGVRVRFGEARDLFAKLVRLETVLSTYSEIPPGTIDVSTREVTLPVGTTEEGEEE